MQYRPLSSLPQHPTALLILVTGIPASGKSTFLAAAQDLLQHGDSSSGTVPLFGGHCRGRIHSVLQLDRVLEDLSSATTQTQDVVLSAGKHKFNPVLWKRATRRLLELTQLTLRACVEEAAHFDGSPHNVVPMVFVEDNMHYRSMRERYYHLCRTLEMGEFPFSSPDETPISAVQLQRPFILLLELRFSTPLDVCLERNAQRMQSWDECVKGSASFSAWVPPPVICSMDALFDRCYAATDGGGHETQNLPKVGRWQWTATTQPWGLVVHATRGALLNMSCSGTSTQAASGFFEVALQQPEAWAECQRQYREFLRNRSQSSRDEREINKASSLPPAAGAAETQTHKLELQLRSVVHAFLCQRHQQKAPETNNEPPSRQKVAEFLKSLSAAKREAAQHFKTQLRQLSREKESTMEDAAVDLFHSRIDEVRESVIQQFQQTVLDLWENLQGG